MTTTAVLTPSQERAIARRIISACVEALTPALQVLRDRSGPSEVPFLELAAGVLDGQARKIYAEAGPREREARRMLRAAASGLIAVAATRRHQTCCLEVMRRPHAQVRHAQAYLVKDALSACVAAECALRKWDAALRGLEVRDA